ncbi:MAG: hypothetical protein QXH84_02970 [Thermosphaera sp.]
MGVTAGVGVGVGIGPGVGVGVYVGVVSTGAPGLVNKYAPAINKMRMTTIKAITTFLLEYANIPSS